MRGLLEGLGVALVVMIVVAGPAYVVTAMILGAL